MSRRDTGTKRKRDEATEQTAVRKRRTLRNGAAVSETDIEYLEKGIAEDASENHRDLERLLRMIDLGDPGAKINVKAGVSLCKVFSRLIASGSLTKATSGTNLSEHVHHWYHQKYEVYRQSIVKLLRSVPVAQRLPILHLCWKVLEQDAELSDNSIWVSNSIFKGLLTAVVEMPEGSEIRRTFTVEYVNQCHDCCYHSLELFSSLIAASKDKRALENIVEMLSVLDAPQSPEELNFLTSPPTKGSKRPLITPMSLRRQAENAWLSILRSPLLSTSLRKSLLRIASDKILPWMARPEILMDFLTDSYNIGGSTSLLALSGLFHLISSKNLDYPSFFPKLYSLIDADLLQSKHRSRFLRLLNTFLESPRLPASLIASFIKRLARRSLFAPPAAIVALIPYIYNLLKAHPSCTFMIHRPGPYTTNHTSSTTTETSIPNPGNDPYNISEPDPQSPNTHALDSSLWEIETLQSHYHPNVASIAKIISQQFTKQRYHIEDFLDHGYASMLESELMDRRADDPAAAAAEREISERNKQENKKNNKGSREREPVVEWRIPKKIFFIGARCRAGSGVDDDGDDDDDDDASKKEPKGGDHEGQGNLVMKLWRF